MTAKLFDVYHAGATPARRRGMMRWLGVLVLAGCVAGGTVPYAAQADGYRFRRGLYPVGPVAIDGDTLHGYFDPQRYAAYWFSGRRNQAVDIQSWTNQFTGDRSASANYALNHLVFLWTPVGDSTDRARPANWTLVRFDKGEFVWSEMCWRCFNQGEERTRMVLPADGDYLLVVLAKGTAYRDRVGYHVSIKSDRAGDTTPGSLRVQIRHRDSRAPAAGVKVTVANRHAVTDESGSASLTDLTPNRYTIKLGPRGYTHFQTRVRPGQRTLETLWLMKEKRDQSND